MNKYIVISIMFLMLTACATVPNQHVPYDDAVIISCDEYGACEPILIPKGLFDKDKEDKAWFTLKTYNELVEKYRIKKGI